MDSKSLYTWEMASKKQAQAETENRQSAYIARNRIALIKATQAVLAEVGLEATAEQLANNAQVSPTTIYKYFESKEALLSEALADAWQEFMTWAHGDEIPGSSFQGMINVFRKLIRAKQTHPQFARILKNTLTDSSFVINAVRPLAMATLQKAASKEEIAVDQFEERVYLWGYTLAGIIAGVFVTEELSPEKADESLAISLEVLDFSKAKAKKLVSQPLVYPESSKS
jgi:AcrR family transcriptional regulator